MRKVLLMTVLIVLTWTNIFAYSFSAIGPGGQTLYYNIISAQVPGMPQSVAVTYPGTSADNPYSGYTQPTGNLVVPASVNYNGTDYIVAEIGERAFYGCTGLTGVLSLPSTITKIGNYAFYNCTGLNSSLSLPNGITNIGEYAFQNCRFEGVLNLPTALLQINNWSFAGCTRFTSVSFPANLTRIGNHAFDNCDGLTGQILIPDAVTSIGWRAFYDCDHITSVNTGNGVQYIYYGAFCHCDALNSLVVGDGVVRIYDFAFYGCNHLTTITMGASLQYIDYSVFAGCTSLSAITSKRISPPIVVTASLYRPDASLTISVDQGSPCSGQCCSTGQSVVIGNGYHTGYFSYHLYKNRHSYNHALYECPTNSSNSFTDSVGISGTYSRSYWFFGALYSIPNEEKPYLETFNGVSVSSIYLNVPCSALQAYQNSQYWQGFIKQGYMSYLVQAQTVDSVMGTAAVTQWPTCANPQAVVSATAQNDFHFTQWNDGNTDNPRTLGVTGDISLTAYFASNWVSVNITSNNANWGNASGSGTYYYNSEVTLYATAQPHYHFVRWNDGNTENPRTETIGQDLILTAVFEADTFHVTTSANDSVMGIALGSGVYPYNQSALLMAIPNDEYHFVRWSDGVTTNPRSILVTQDTTITAHFASNWLMVNTSSNNELWGSASGGGSYYYQTAALVTAEPNEHYHFVCWSDSSTENPRSIQVTEEISLTAIFAPNEYVLQLVTDDVNMGSVSGGGELSIWKCCRNICDSQCRLSLCGMERW
ncbi:MAG: leucine-rich repeat domain-containing protein [Bacteroidales bacterium]|nr:leucine-rich repeat domain-containing protein [Bacteroidales bacterium]